MIPVKEVILLYNIVTIKVLQILRWRAIATCTFLIKNKEKINLKTKSMEIYLQIVHFIFLKLPQWITLGAPPF